MSGPIHPFTAATFETADDLAVLNDFVLVRVTPPVATTRSGIILPELAKMRLAWDEGVVLAVGPGKLARKQEKRVDASRVQYVEETYFDRRTPMSTKVGDRVLFARTAGFGGEMVRSDETLLFLREEQIEGVLADGAVLG